MREGSSKYRTTEDVACLLVALGLSAYSSTSGTDILRVLAQFIVLATAWFVARQLATTDQDRVVPTLATWVQAWGVSTVVGILLLGTEPQAAWVTLAIGGMCFGLARAPHSWIREPEAAAAGLVPIPGLASFRVQPDDDGLTGRLATTGVPTETRPAVLPVPARLPDTEDLLWHSESERREKRSARRLAAGPAASNHAGRNIGMAVKRILDVVGASVGIIILLPVLILSALLVKASGPGPILFGQLRLGRGGKVFTCYKFRTMCVGAEAQQDALRKHSIQDGPAFKIPGDPRVTRVGRLLRKFSLDELPQLFNVLVGDMSIVGPRPPIPAEVHRYAWWQRRRVAVKPGLTCVWQVWGRNRVTFKRWVEMDLYYIDNWSVWLDLKLIAHTFSAVLRGTGM
jgi:lipopolysaccharide/colanic/teichoic acid biosynthesis glycosyltransferase